MLSWHFFTLLHRKSLFDSLRITITTRGIIKFQEKHANHNQILNFQKMFKFFMGGPPSAYTLVGTLMNTWNRKNRSSYADNSFNHSVCLSLFLMNAYCPEYRVVFIVELLYSPLSSNSMDVSSLFSKYLEQMVRSTVSTWSITAKFDTIGRCDSTVILTRWSADW